MVGISRIRRTHGIMGGTLIALLGAWGALIPFIGPYFHYAYTPATAWTYNTGRLWLEILPGGAALLGGILLVIARSRYTALFGAFVGIVSGAWFALGPVLAPLWTTPAPAGVPASFTTLMRTAEQIGFFTGLGVVMVLVAAAAAGRLTAVPALTAPAETPAPTTVMAAERDVPTVAMGPADRADTRENTQVIR